VKVSFLLNSLNGFLVVIGLSLFAAWTVWRCLLLFCCHLRS